MPNQRRTPVRRAPVQSRQKRKTSRAQAWFPVVALVTVVAMLVGAVGSAVVLDIFNDDPDDDVIDFDGSDEDPIERDLRAEYAANPDDAEVIARLANYLSTTRGGVESDPTESLRLYEEALTVDPDNLSIRLDFAGLLNAAGSDGDAEIQYLKIVEADATIEFGGIALLDLAQLYRDWEPPRIDDAVQRYNEVIARYPDSVLSEVAREDLVELGVATPAASPAVEVTSSPTAVTLP